jgi:hypothetical protein
MEEANIRGEVSHMLREMGYWPITQTDAYAPFDIAGAKRLLAALASKVGPHIKPLVFQLGNILDNAQFKPPLGRPDILVLDPLGPSRVVEVKALNLKQSTSFAFKAIEDNQRKWLDNWQEARGHGFIALGTIVPRGKHRHLWIVPWSMWKQIEAQITPYQQSIPFSAGKGYRTELQAGLDLLRLMGDYACQRQNGHWVLPSEHALHRSTPE